MLAEEAPGPRDRAVPAAGDGEASIARAIGELDRAGEVDRRALAEPRGGELGRDQAGVLGLESEAVEPGPVGEAGALDGVGGCRHGDREELEIGAPVGQHDGAVGGTHVRRVVAAGRGAEAQGGVAALGLVEVRHQDHRMVEIAHAAHPPPPLRHFGSQPCRVSARSAQSARSRAAIACRSILRAPVSGSSSTITTRLG